MNGPVLEALDRVLNLEGGTDEVLWAVVRLLSDQPTIGWAGIAFLEGRDLVIGPAAGQPDELHRIRVPVAFQSARVGELWVDGDADVSVLERVALLISVYVLTGWDTHGESWEP
jgi:hypothetical protein